MEVDGAETPRYTVASGEGVAIAGGFIFFSFHVSASP